MRIPSGILAGAMLALAVLGASTMNAQNGSSAKGKLHIGKQDFTLTQAFAVREPDPMGDGKNAEKVTILLSDAPVPEEMRKATNEWMSWAADQSGG